MDIYNEYPELAASLERLSASRYLEILQDLMETDDEYSALQRARAGASAALLGAVTNPDALESYTDAVFRQECFELEAVYRRGFIDALEISQNLGLFG